MISPNLESLIVNWKKLGIKNDIVHPLMWHFVVFKSHTQVAVGHGPAGYHSSPL